MKKIILFFTLIGIIIGLGYHYCDNDNQVLGHDYYYLPDYEALDMGYVGGGILYKSGIKNSFENVIIPANVVKVKANKRYIIAIQKPDREVAKSILKKELKFWSDYYAQPGADTNIQATLPYRKSVGNRDILFQTMDSAAISCKVDSILSNEKFYTDLFKESTNYYIIDKDRNFVFGPLSITNFYKLLTEKKVNLKF